MAKKLEKKKYGQPDKFEKLEHSYGKKLKGLQWKPKV